MDVAVARIHVRARARLVCAATPDNAGEAPTARLVKLAGGRTTSARPAAILDEGSNEVGMHGRFLPLRCELRQVGGFRFVHGRMRRNVRTRLLRDRTGPGRAGTSRPT